MRIGVYNRHWNTLGGGEKHAGAAAEALSADHEVELIGHEPFDAGDLGRALNLDLSATRQVVWRESDWRALSQRTAAYDVFVNASYGSALPSRARHSAYLVFFPHPVVPPFFACFGALGRALSGADGRATSSGFLRTYGTLMANSEYTRSWVERRWKRPAVTLLPPVDVRLFRTPAGQRKAKVVLSVARFFRVDYNKKQLEMVDAFRKICERGLLPPGWELHVAGNVLQGTAHFGYLEEVRRLARGYPVKVLADLPLDRLREEYQAASIFWHATGWNEDEARHPERFEHFGISTCEAMSAGCVPVVIAKAGQLELVEDGRNGFTFLTEDELIEKTLRCMRMYETGELGCFARAAEVSTERLDRERFRQRARELLLAQAPA